MRKNGWFGFTKNYYTFEADTLQKKDTADLLMMIKEYTRNQSPENARPFKKYRFGNVDITWDKDLVFNRRVLRNINTIRHGEPYNEEVVNTTYSRLAALRLFSGVNIAMTPRDTTDIVDCEISLTRSRMQGFKVNLEGSTNSSGLIGNSPQVSYYHKNIFHGGEWLNLGFMGNFQFLYGDRSIRSNEFGFTSSISLPKFLGLSNTLFLGPSIPRTEFAVSYTYQDRPEYTRNMMSTSFSYSGFMEDGKFYYQFTPFQAKIVRMTHLDPSFYETLEGNPVLRDAYQNHFDMGAGAMVYYTTCPDISPKVSYQYFRFQLDASGNILSLFDNYMRTDQFGARKIWGAPYSQYVRTELTLGKTVVFGRSSNQAIAMRLMGGVGKAYGNSVTMPFEKQFYSGGAASMRGWQVRALGPGRSKPNATFLIPSQTGDVKLEANLEYRFPLFWKLCGALFTDIGNVWTLYGSEEDDLSQFKFDKLGESIGANWGYGLRADLGFLILRVDMGMKLYDPSLDSDCWFGPDRMFSKNSFAIHFGVGYPF